MRINKSVLIFSFLFKLAELAEYLHTRGAHYVFIAKDHQPTLAADIRLHFTQRGEPDFREPPCLQHGRVEIRAIWTSTAVNDYLDFPHVGQVFAIGLIKSKSTDSVAATIAKLARKTRRVLDYLGMTANSAPRDARAVSAG